MAQCDGWRFRQMDCHNEAEGFTCAECGLNFCHKHKDLSEKHHKVITKINPFIAVGWLYPSESGPCQLVA